MELKLSPVKDRALVVSHTYVCGVKAYYNYCSLLGIDERETKSSGGGSSKRRSLFDDQSSNTASDNANTDTLEHPVFPWQNNGRSSSLPTPGRRQSPLHSIDTGAQQQPIVSKPQAPRTDNDKSNQSAMLASFQEQLLEQQKRLQDQLTSFQSESVSIAAKASSSQAEVVTLQTQLKKAEEKVKELETTLDSTKTQLLETQVYKLNIYTTET